MQSPHGPATVSGERASYSFPRLRSPATTGRASTRTSLSLRRWEDAGRARRSASQETCRHGISSFSRDAHRGTGTGAGDAGEAICTVPVVRTVRASPARRHCCSHPLARRPMPAAQTGGQHSRPRPRSRTDRPVAGATVIVEGPDGGAADHRRRPRRALHRGAPGGTAAIAVSASSAGLWRRAVRACRLTAGSDRGSWSCRRASARSTSS